MISMRLILSTTSFTALTRLRCRPVPATRSASVDGSVTSRQTSNGCDCCRPLRSCARCTCRAPRAAASRRAPSPQCVTGRSRFCQRPASQMYGLSGGIDRSTGLAGGGSSRFHDARFSPARPCTCFVPSTFAVRAENLHGDRRRRRGRSANTNVALPPPAGDARPRLVELEVGRLRGRRRGLRILSSCHTSRRIHSPRP